MDRYYTYLTSKADRVVAGAIESADADAFETPLRAIVAQLPVALSDGSPLETRSLRDSQADDVFIARVLRAIQAETIEVLRSESGDEPFAEVVLALRECIRKSLPRIPIDSRCAHLKQAMELGFVKTPGGEGDDFLAFIHTVLNSFGDMVYAHDVNGVLFFINDRGLELLKYSREDLFDGMSIYDFVVPDYLDLVEARLESPGAVVRSPYSIEVYAKDGARVPIEIDTRPIFAREGEVIAVAGLARDLRLERRLQDELSRSYADLECLFDALPVGVIMTRTDGRIINANPVAIALCGAADVNDLVGVNARTLWEGGCKEAGEAVTRALASSITVRRRCVGATRFGAHLQCDLTAQPMMRDGEPCGFLILIIDVSEELKLHRNLIQTEKMSALGELIAGLAHELNNPLTGILGNAQFALESPNQDSIHKHVDLVVEGAQRCKRIVENLLSFASGRPGEKSPLDLNSMLRETLELREYQLRADGIDLIANYDEKLPPVSVDQHQMRQVFMNIVNNAQQALAAVEGRQRALTVSTRRDGDKAVVTFADNGPGIPAAIQNRIFDPFFTTKPPGFATGLGLSVSFGIVQEHGGTLHMDSEEGRGAAFHIELPIA